MTKTAVRAGDGWAVYTTPDGAWIKFNHKPDGATLSKLRNVAVWDPMERAWRADPRSAPDLLAIGDKAQTWESVGEDPPSMFDDADYPIFHD